MRSESLQVEFLRRIAVQHSLGDRQDVKVAFNRLTETYGTVRFMEEYASLRAFIMAHGPSYGKKKADSNGKAGLQGHRTPSPGIGSMKSHQHRQDLNTQFNGYRDSKDRSSHNDTRRGNMKHRRRSTVEVPLSTPLLEQGASSTETIMEGDGQRATHAVAVSRESSYGLSNLNWLQTISIGLDGVTQQQEPAITPVSNAANGAPVPGTTKANRYHAQQCAKDERQRRHSQQPFRESGHQESVPHRGNQMMPHSLQQSQAESHQMQQQLQRQGPYQQYGAAGGPGDRDTQPTADRTTLANDGDGPYTKFYDGSGFGGGAHAVRPTALRRHTVQHVGLQGDASYGDGSASSAMSHCTLGLGLKADGDPGGEQSTIHPQRIGGADNDDAHSGNARRFESALMAPGLLTTSPPMSKSNGGPKRQKKRKQVSHPPPDGRHAGSNLSESLLLSGATPSPELALLVTPGQATATSGRSGGSHAGAAASSRSSPVLTSHTLRTMLESLLASLPAQPLSLGAIAESLHKNPACAASPMSNFKSMLGQCLKNSKRFRKQNTPKGPMWELVKSPASGASSGGVQGAGGKCKGKRAKPARARANTTGSIDVSQIRSLFGVNMRGISEKSSGDLTLLGNSAPMDAAWIFSPHDGQHSIFTSGDDASGTAGVVGATLGTLNLNQTGATPASPAADKVMTSLTFDGDDLFDPNVFNTLTDAEAPVGPQAGDHDHFIDSMLMNSAPGDMGGLDMLDASMDVEPLEIK